MSDKNEMFLGGEMMAHKIHAHRSTYLWIITSTHWFGNEDEERRNMKGWHVVVIWVIAKQIIKVQKQKDSLKMHKKSKLRKGRDRIEKVGFLVNSGGSKGSDAGPWMWFQLKIMGGWVSDKMHTCKKTESKKLV